MATEPNTLIKLYRGVPFDIDYRDTLYFPSDTAQKNYFDEVYSYSFNEQYYQRINKNTLRIQKSAEELMDCNYLSITNKNHGNRTFYGFITDVSYINENTCEVKYEIDILQSYLFHYVTDTADVQIKDSYIEREHSYTDIIGENIEPEPVDTGEIVFNGNMKPILSSLNEMCVIIAICDVDEQAVEGNLYDGIYGGATLYVYSATDVQDINTFLANYIQKPDAVVGMYMCPKFCVGETIPANHRLPYGASGHFFNFLVLTDTIFNADSTLDGHTVVNKKLFTYPYNFIHIENGSGSDLNLRYEFFGADNSEFRPVVGLKSTVTQPVIIKLFPQNYKGVPKQDGIGNANYNYSEELQLDTFPSCSWNSDFYKSWLSQNAVPMVLNTATTIANARIHSSLYSSEERQNASLATSGISAVASLLSNFYSASIHEDIMKGKVNNGGGNVSMNMQNFFAVRASVTSQKAKIIDDFFTMYGYATNKVKKPNLFNGTYSRPYYYYVKTVGANVKGMANADVLKRISDIFDNGITFWLNPAQYGNYSVDNRPQ